MSGTSFGRSRPFGVGTVFRQTARVCRSNFGRFALFVAITTAISALINVLFLKGLGGSAGGGAALFRPLLIGAIGIPFEAAINGAVLVTTFSTLNGKRIGLGPSALIGIGKIIPLTALTIVKSLAAGVASILLVVPGVLILLRWFVAAPARVIEGPGLHDALGRSARLTKGHRWSLFGLVLLYFILTVVVGGVAGAILGIGMFGLGGRASPTLGLFALSLFNKTIGLIGTVGTAAAYAELRREKEGGLDGDMASLFD